MVDVTDRGPATDPERRRHPLWPTYVAVDDLLVTGRSWSTRCLPVREAAR